MSSFFGTSEILFHRDTRTTAKQEYPAGDV